MRCNQVTVCGLTVMITIGLGILLMPERVSAQIVCFWDDSGGGLFSESDNWDPTGPPGPLDIGIFDLGPLSAYTVELDGNTTIAQALFRTGIVDLNMNGNTFRVEPNLFVGFDVGDDGHFIPYNGTLHSDWADVGHYSGFAGAPGDMTLSGSNTQWQNDNDITVGRGTTGVVHVNQGATVTLGGDAYIGNALSAEDTAEGTVNLADPGSTWTCVRSLIGITAPDGPDVTGRFNVQNQAILDCSGQIAAGIGADGYFSIDSGGSVISKKGDSSTGTSGLLGIAQGGSYGFCYANVTDPGSSWTQDGVLVVGWSAQGILDIKNSAIVESQEAIIGRLPGADGLADIDGGTWNVWHDMVVGGVADMSGGLGQVHLISEGSRLRIHDDDDGTDHTLKIWPNGSLVVDHGRVAIGSDVFTESGSVRLAEAGILDMRGGFVGALSIYVEGRLNASSGGSRIQANVTFQTDSQTDIDAGAELELIGNGHIVAGAQFSGTGKIFNSSGSTLVMDDGATIGVTIDNAGRVELGNSIGVVDVINGSFEQRSDGTLELDIHGTAASQFDSLHITGGSAILGGTLVATVPQPGPVLPGDEFEVMTFDFRVGDVVVDTIAPTAPGLWFEREYRGGETNLTLIAAAIPGDFDLDADVDGDDFLVWQTGFGTTSGADWLTGDADGDADVDGDDFLIWQSHFGNSLGSSSTVVPEPVTAWIAMIAMVIGLAVPRSRLA